MRGVAAINAGGYFVVAVEKVLNIVSTTGLASVTYLANKYLDQNVSFFFTFSCYSSSITQLSSCSYIFPLQFHSFSEAIRTQIGKYKGKMTLPNQK